MLKIDQIMKNDILIDIRKLKPKKSLGPDKIPPYIFKGCAELFVEPLSLIFNAIIKFATYPTKWKKCKLCPIFQSDNKSNIKIIGL